MSDEVDPLDEITPARPPSGEAAGRVSGSLQLTPTMVRVAANCVRAGNFRHTARAKLGIGAPQWANWMHIGQREVEELRLGQREHLSLRGELWNALDRAEGECHEGLIRDVLETDSVAAKQWFLERRYPKLYKAGARGVFDDENSTTRLDAGEILAERLMQLIAAREGVASVEQLIVDTTVADGRTEPEPDEGDEGLVLVPPELEVEEGA